MRWYLPAGLLALLLCVLLELIGPVPAVPQTFGEGFSDDEKKEELQTILSLPDEDKVDLFNRLSRSEKQAAFKLLDPDQQLTLFSRMEDADKLMTYRGLSDPEKNRLFKQLGDNERNTLFGALDDAEKRFLFDGMRPEEKRIWMARYPNLDLILDSDQIDALKSAPVDREKEDAAKVSRMERVLSGYFPSEISRELKQFGYDYFQRGASFREPLIHIPVGEDYLIGPGDSFSIYLWGKVEKQYRVSVSSEGRIVVPRVGSLLVGGLRLSETKVLLKNKFKEFYPEFEMSITMEQLRAVQIFVIGEVVNPGTYTVSSLSTVIAALFAAGGPNKNGSLRNIQLVRPGSERISIDLYDFFIMGEKRDDVRLRSGDTLFVPLIGPVVGVSGKVRRPAIYELKSGETLGKTLRFAGGALPFGYLQNVVIERIEGNRRRVTKSFNLDPANINKDENLRIPLLDGDVVKIYPVHRQMRKVVYLEGHVKHPREFELKTGLRLRHLLPSYDVLLPEPYLPRAEIIRLAKPDLHPEIIPFNLEELLAGKADQNLMLQDMDRVKVYGYFEKMDVSEVSIYGAVRIPGSYRLLEGMTVKDLIFRAGNLSDGAYMDTASITRIAPGETKTETITINFSPERAMTGLVTDNVVLRPHDKIHIREIPQYSDALLRKVFLEGEFRFPGEYSFSDGERISSVIKRAGGMSLDAYPFGAIFLREDVKKVQMDRIKDYISNLEEDILTLSAQTSETTLAQEEAEILAETLKAKKQLLDKMKSAKPTGRMVLDLERVLAQPFSDFDLKLRPGDRLIVGKRPDYVNVLGEVYNPTALMVVNGMKVGYYLDKVGGANDSADEKQIYLVRANGTVISKRQEGFGGIALWDAENNRWTMTQFNSLVVDPGDTIIVPKKVVRYPWLRVIKGVTEIAFQIAVTAGVLIAAGI